MFCRTCSNEVNDKAVVCLKCGVPPTKGNDYCYSCGVKTQPNAIICVSCGVGLKNAIGNTINGSVENVIKKPVFWAAFLLLIAFFLPWLEDHRISVSGWQLRDLVRLLRMEDDDFRANNLVYLMYFLPIISIIIIASYFTENTFIHKRLISWKALAGLYPWLFLFLLLSAGGRFSDYIAYGFVITLASASYLLYDAIVIYRNNNSNKKNDSNENLTVINPKNNVEVASITPKYGEPIAETSDIGFPIKKSNKTKIIIGSLIGIIAILGMMYLFQREKTTVASTTTIENTPQTSVAEPQKELPTSHENIKKTYWVLTEKTYFYTEPNLNTKRQAYLEKGQKLEGCCEQNSFLNCTFVNDKGQITQGWLYTNTLSETEITTSSRYFEGTRKFCSNDNSCYFVSINNNLVVVKNSNNEKVIEGLINNGNIESKNGEPGVIDFSLQDSKTLIINFEDDNYVTCYYKN